MPNDFSQTVRDQVFVKMTDIYATQATVNKIFANTPVTAAAVMANQTANLVPVMDNTGNVCTGLKVYYPLMDDETIGSISNVPVTSDCQIDGQYTASTAVKEYNLNVFEKRSFKVSDNDCDNHFDFQDRVAFGLVTEMQKFALSLNNYVIAFCDTNKATPVNANLPDGVTVVNNEYTITGADYWTGIESAKIMPVFDQLAQINGLPDNYYIISGKALQQAYNYSADRALNDNERSYAQTFRGKDIVFDTKNLDPIIQDDCVYLVDPNVFASYFYRKYPAAPEAPIERRDDLNTTEFALPLDFFSQYQNGNTNRATLQFMNNMAPEDVYVNVRYQYRCGAEDPNGFKTYEHNWELQLAGMIDLIPRSNNEITGIIRVNKAV